MNFPRAPRTVLVRAYDVAFTFAYWARFFIVWAFFVLSPVHFDGGER